MGGNGPSLPSSPSLKGDTPSCYNVAEDLGQGGDCWDRPSPGHRRLGIVPISQVTVGTGTEGALRLCPLCYGVTLSPGLSIGVLGTGSAWTGPLTPHPPMQCVVNSSLWQGGEKEVGPVESHRPWVIS